MSKTSRTKGRKGESTAKKLLLDRDYEVSDLNNGLSTCDLLATDEAGVTWSVEVKNAKIINIPTFLTQARENATPRKPWMLMCHIHNSKEWIVMRKGKKTTIWTEKG